MEPFLNLLTGIGTVTAALELVLYGRLSGKNEEPRAPPRGDRLAGWLENLEERWAEGSRGAAAGMVRWSFRVVLALTLVALVVVVIYAVGFFFFEAFQPEASGGSGDLGEAIGELIGQIIAIIFIGVFLLAALIALVFLALALIVLQASVLGVRGGAPLLAKLVGFIGRYPKRILGAGAALAVGAQVVALVV